MSGRAQPPATCQRQTGGGPLWRAHTPGEGQLWGTGQLHWLPWDQPRNPLYHGAASPLRRSVGRMWTTGAACALCKEQMEGTAPSLLLSLLARRARLHSFLWVVTLARVATKEWSEPPDPLPKSGKMRGNRDAGPSGPCVRGCQTATRAPAGAHVASSRRRGARAG